MKKYLFVSLPVLVLVLYVALRVASFTLFNTGLMLGSKPLCLLAFQLGASTEQRENGRTPLHYALEQGKPDTIKMLLDLGSDPNSRWGDEVQSTPLMQSADSSRLDITRLLLEKGANPNLKNNLGYDAMYFAKNNTKMLGLLKKYNPP